MAPISFSMAHQGPSGARRVPAAENAAAYFASLYPDGPIPKIEILPPHVPDTFSPSDGPMDEVIKYNELETLILKAVREAQQKYRDYPRIVEEIKDVLTDGFIETRKKARAPYSIRTSLNVQLDFIIGKANARLRDPDVDLMPIREKVIPYQTHGTQTGGPANHPHEDGGHQGWQNRKPLAAVHITDVPNQPQAQLSLAAEKKLQENFYAEPLTPDITKEKAIELLQKKLRRLPSDLPSRRQNTMRSTLIAQAEAGLTRIKNGYPAHVKDLQYHVLVDFRTRAIDLIRGNAAAVKDYEARMAAAKAPLAPAPAPGPPLKRPSLQSEESRKRLRELSSPAEDPCFNSQGEIKSYVRGYQAAITDLAALTPLPASATRAALKAMSAKMAVAGQVVSEAAKKDERK